MKKILFLSLIIMSIIGCKDNNLSKKNSETNSNNMNKKYEDTLYNNYAPLMVKFLKDENFKTLDNIEFKKRIQELFGVDIDESEYDDVNPRLKGAETNIHNIYSIMRKDNFIDFYILDRGKIDGAGDPLKSMLTDERSNEDNFILYNKLLLNDDISVLSYILNDKTSLEDIYVYFNYEKNESIKNKLISTLKDIDDYPVEFKNSLIWYNDINKNENIRKNTLVEIGKKKPDFLFDLTSYVISNRETIKKPFNAYTDKAIATLISIQLDLSTGDFVSGNKGYALLNNMFVQNPSMKEILKKQSYFDFENVKKASEHFEMNNGEENTDELYLINDKDGYTNLRKGKNANSEIITKLNNGSELYVLDKSDKDWWLVVTPIGEQGYVHKSRIVSK
uniref:SH3 domain-containing protein n=2 Tax=Flavobacteriaceae TaxID=49546 RepID=A0AA94F3P5_9FLAO